VKLLRFLEAGIMGYTFWRRILFSVSGQKVTLPDTSDFFEKIKS
jgi:hypothetical protein